MKAFLMRKFSMKASLSKAILLCAILIAAVIVMLIVNLAACEDAPTLQNQVMTQGNTAPTVQIGQPGEPPTSSSFILTSPDVVEAGELPSEYTCDGASATLALAWSGAPAETQSYAVVMHHVAGQDDVHWYWVLYDIPADVTSLTKNNSGIGTLGNNSVNGRAEYAPPCSKGPGEKIYTVTVYALSEQPHFSVPSDQVSRDVLLAAIQEITLSSAELHLSYARQNVTVIQTRQVPPAGIRDQKNDQKQPGAGYNIEQAISDKAQGMTIAFDALAFLTGDLGSASFFPPGKVADFWGFQYLRDNDSSRMGHAGDFLTSAAMNVLNVLTANQREQLVTLAQSQVPSIDEYAYKRFVLIQAFQRLLEGDLPGGTTGLDEEAVKAYSAELYQLDGEISYARAELMGSLIRSLNTDQLAYLDAMVGKGMLEWPTVEEPADMRSLEPGVKVAVMTYAADLFSWYAGSVEADVYFCPERHGTYFGSFYLKDIHAMSDPGYAIPTDMTGNLGDAVLATLDATQAALISGLVDIQKPSLLGIVETREQIAIELRKFLTGETADKATVLSLMQHYGELDGEIIYNLTTNFVKVNQSLTGAQKEQIMAMRQELLGDLIYPSGAYLYSQPIAMPDIPDTDFLFAAP